MLSNAFDVILWILTKRKAGIRTLRLLSLSSVTGLWGTLGLTFSQHSHYSEKLVASAKLLLIVCTWLSGILLFARTKITVVNQTVATYDVTAGVGIFRGSYVSEFIDALQDANAGYNNTILPYSIITTASQLVTNPTHVFTTEPVDCNQGKACMSYLLPGGLIMATPLQPLDHEDYPTITIHQAPAAQLDFEKVVEQQQLFDDANDCMVFGSDDWAYGVQLCLAEDVRRPDSLIAGDKIRSTDGDPPRRPVTNGSPGLFVCLNGTHNGKCITSINPPRLITALTAYQRLATVTSARSNMSILSIQDLSPPLQQVDLPIEALKHALSWLFNSTASNVPAPSSIAQYFWSAQDQLNNGFWSTEAHRYFQSLLAFPFWHFNDNNYGNVRLEQMAMVDSLPTEFYTFAAVGKPMSKIAVDR
jgi:hypothetical protein